MSKNIHKRLRELQRVAALHQINPNGTPLGTVAPTPTGSQGFGAPVVSDAQVATPATGERSTFTMAIGTPAHYKVIRKDLNFVVILMLVMVALLFGCWWMVNNTGLAGWIVNLGSSIR